MMKNYIKYLQFYFTIFLLLGSYSMVAQNNLIAISGKILDATTKDPLIGVPVQIKGTFSGTTTDETGTFILKTAQKLPLVLVVSYVGYKQTEIEVQDFTKPLNLELTTESVLGEIIVTAASRTEERILQSPVAIEKLDIRAIQASPAASFYDALDNLKGVQLTTSSLTFKIPNSRGFNIPNNFRFMQLVDGVDVQAATLGVPLGNAIGATELDILSIEVTPGAASALYGMNAINGLASLQTKSPFTHQGLSVYQKTGVNHVDSKDHSPALLSEFAIRYAKAFNNKFAFKVNASYLQGTDWISNTLTDQNPNDLVTANPKFLELNENTAASDLWNRYGDERNNRTIVTVNYQGKNQTFNVARTGYLEKDLTPSIVKNIKFDGGLYYRINEKLEASYTYRYGIMDGTFQRGNKIRLEGVTVQNHKLELKHSDFNVRLYASLEDTGNSYNLKPLSDNLDLNNGSNTVWAGRFKNTLQTALNQGIALDQAFVQARIAADKGRVEPSTAEFDALKQTIINTNNWDIAANVAGAPVTGGAWLKQSSNTYHAEGQWDLSRKVKFANVLIGADYRIYEVTPDGNNFVDFSRPLAERTTPTADGSFGSKQYYKKYGAFVQLTKKLFDDKLKINASLRIDYNPEFTAKLNPRIAIVYSPNPDHNFRISFQNGWRFPALFEALSFVNNGNVRRVGGLPRVNEGIGFLENSYTLTSIDAFNAAVNTDISAGITTNQAIANNKQKLIVANLPNLRPENINSFEVGYKSLFADNVLSIDWEAYLNIYDGFLGQVEVAVPQSGKVGSDAAVLDMRNRAKQDRYRVFANSLSQNVSYGSTIGIKYNFFKQYTVSANVNYNDIQEVDRSDIFITAFNTPKWVTNLSFGNREIVKNFGFNVVGKWQDTFQWESPLANGTVPAFFTLDAQVNLRLPDIKTIIKVGATNVLNNRYIQYAAGPTLGGLYYITLTYDVGLSK
jgi:iron complex outermembrane recepter protein